MGGVEGKRWIERTTGQVSEVPVANAARERIHTYERVLPQQFVASVKNVEG